MTETTPQLQCSKCKTIVDARDNYCRGCGVALSNNAKHESQWYFKSWGVVLVMLMVGPFAWYNAIASPVLSKKEKWFYSILILLFTALVVYALYEFVQLTTGRLEAVMKGDLTGL